ncbi:MAG: hypothetical protein ACI81L_002433 [Verrucomicrobiales bacterium]|jgi:hypothetical protein
MPDAAETAIAPAVDTEAQAIELATEMRAQGHPRTNVIAQLSSYGVSETAAEYLANQVDLFAGMFGRAHPADIDQCVREQIDQDGPMMMTENLGSTVQRTAPTSGQREQVIAKAREMVESGYHESEIVKFLVTNGAPQDQAISLASKLASGQRNTTAEKKKKRRGLLRR